MTGARPDSVRSLARRPRGALSAPSVPAGRRSLAADIADGAATSISTSAPTTTGPRPAHWVEEHWGGLDVLVNNAGVAGGGRIDVAGMDEWPWITEINLFGVVRGTRTFVSMFKEPGVGHIVNIASLAGLVHPAGMGSYNAVKAGVVALSETTSHELAEYGVRCTDGLPVPTSGPT